MVMKAIDAPALKRAFLNAAKNLEAKREWINELNVFPVPDGDTGTNMSMTIMAAAREVAAIENPTMENLAKAISSGSLRGARGNSGVILSQLFRGFTKEIKTADQVTAKVLANAMDRGTETAYKAVMKPKEGTILTVARGMSDQAAKLAEDGGDIDIIEFCRQVIAEGDRVLSQTPEMLPVLKQAGVVDSGGQGLMQVVKGALDGLLGREIQTDVIPAASSGAAFQADKRAAADAQAEIKFGYCTEFIINLEKPLDGDEEKRLKAYLESIGDSIVVVADEDVVKIHVHTNDPGLAIQRALTYGSLSKIKIDNMREEHQERLIQDAERLAAEQRMESSSSPVSSVSSASAAENGAETGDGGHGKPKKFGFIAVAAGDGLAEIFKGLGADDIIRGGQTMNPSTEDILQAIQRINAEKIFIFPNNKNIILAAEQARNLTKDKEITVVPSKTIPQGIAALISFVPELSVQENLDAMAEEMARVRTGQITYAVRSTVIEGKEIGEGDIMALGDQGILAVGKEIEATALEAIGAMVDSDTELLGIYYGDGVSSGEAEHLLEQVKERFPECDVDLQYGGQPVYYYLISAE